MNYEELFPKQDCVCSTQIRGVIVALSAVILLIDCVTSCRRTRKVNELTTENKTLKSIILSAVDRALVKMMKNGNDSNVDDDE